MIVVVGENVVDLVPAGSAGSAGSAGAAGSADAAGAAGGLLRPALGGGPANVAVAAARLGGPVAMAARLGRDAFGAAFRRRLESSGVDTRYLVQTGSPSTLALATLNERGEARFDFWLAGAADFGWRVTDLPDPRPGDVLHVGSLAAFLPPGADAIEQWTARHRPQCTVTFDPNIRQPSLARPDSLVRLERLAGLAHVIRVSEGDLRLAYPSVEPIAAARRWLANGGTELVVLTRGAGGATALTRDGEVSVFPPDVDVVDTIGAGDTAMGALLVGLHASPRPPVEEMLRDMCDAAALTCARPGADPPSAAELVAFRSGRSPLD